jgi:hypothetical protein
MPWPLIGGIAGAIGSIFGKSGEKKADERAAQSNYAAEQARTQQQALLALLGLQERGTMDRAQLGITAPQDRARQALVGSLLSRLQPTRVTPPAGINMGQISGGLGAALGGPGAQMAGRLLQQQALQALLSGRDVPAMPNYVQQGMIQQPGYQQPSRGEGFLSALGLGGSLLGGVLGAIPRKVPSTQNRGYAPYPTAPPRIRP